MENPAAPLLSEKQNSGYNNFFTLVGKRKMPAYIDEQGKVQILSYKAPNCDKWYHLTYQEANKILSEYRKKHKDTFARVSLWLDNAKYDDLFVFILDFDKIDGKVDTDGSFFKGALQVADKVTRSQGGGYHLFYGIDKEKAEPLFDSINLLPIGGKKSFVNKTRCITTDGKNKVDFFCDVPHPIYEWEEWDNTIGLTDKTQALYELIRDNFDFATSTNPRKRKANSKSTNHANKAPRVKREPRQYTEIAELEESELVEKMNEEQRKIFVDLKTISSDCSRTDWYKIGLNIRCVFGDELGGEVFFYWSKAYKDFDAHECYVEWDSICDKDEPELWNNRWRAIMGLALIVDEEEAERQAKIQRELKELGEQIRAERQAKMPAPPSETEKELLEWACSCVANVENDCIVPSAEPLTFRGLPIQWEHEARNGNALDGEERGARERHRISWNHIKHDKRDTFFKAAWGAEYKKVRAKVNFKGQTADNVLWLTIGQRTALEYDALYYRYIDELVFVTEQDEKELKAFFASDNCSTSRDTLRKLNYEDGAKKIVTFGVGRQQDGAAEHTWCYTKEAVKGGNRYRGVSLDWSLWAYGIEKAYNDYLQTKDKKATMWDFVRPAMYCQYQNGELCRMTYSAEDYQ